MKNAAGWLIAAIMLLQTGCSSSDGVASSGSYTSRVNSGEASSVTSSEGTASVVSSKTQSQSVSLAGSIPTGSKSASSGKLSSNVQGDEGLKLEPYMPPNDGIKYDMTPLTINAPMNIITRKQDKLYDGSKELRFISANAPTLLDCSKWEQEDLIKSLAQMGGQVSRTYTFSVNTASQGTSASTGNFILGKGIYNEDAMKRLDYLLWLCNKYGIRLIIPFIDPYEYNGGIPAFNELFGKKVTGDNSLILNAAKFYSDSAIKKQFFHFVKYVLSRKNTITGVYYKDDPAILAWECGNEMPYYHETAPYYDGWMQEFIQTVKSVDTKHLIMDGAAFGIRSQAANDPNIDIVTVHMYPHTVSSTYANECRSFRNYFKGKKPLIVGEFGFVTTDVVEELYNEAMSNGTAGTLFWSLRQHSEQGSFIQHRENEKYWSYHWPGFSAGDSYDAAGLLRLSYLKAYEIQGKAPKIIQTPDIPKIITPIKRPQQSIIWRGSTGAYGYDIQRAENKNGPWVTIGVNVSDDFVATGTSILFADTSKNIVAGKTYYYRIRARSTGGYSDWSQPVSAVADRDT